MVASSVAVVALGQLANDGAVPDASSDEMRVSIAGVPLAPGWFLLRGAFESARPQQSLGWFVLIIGVSFVVDTALVFAAWEYMQWRRRGRRTPAGG
jgi:hypothetical protein